MGDELFPGKISVANFTTALDALAATKQEFPNLLIWENQGGTGWIGVLHWNPAFNCNCVCESVRAFDRERERV